MKGVLDRMEDGKWAVILLEEVNREIIVPAAELPEGSRIKSWFDIDFDDSGIVSIELDPRSTAIKEQRVEQLMRNLRSRRSGSRFKRK